MKIFLKLIILFFFCINNAEADLIKPNINLKPLEVLEIQLNSLKNNNIPYEDAGIEQTWEFGLHCPSTLVEEHKWQSIGGRKSLEFDIFLKEIEREIRRRRRTFVFRYFPEGNTKAIPPEADSFGIGTSP